MTPMIPDTGDYRTAGGTRITIARFGKRGRFAYSHGGGKWRVANGEQAQDPTLNITGPWVAKPVTKAIECWVNDYADNNRAAHWTKHTAETFAGNNCRRPAVHMVEASELARVQAEARKHILALINRDDRNTCRHEETHRGGVIWEICDQCGAKWADDRGGKPAFQEPREWVEARAFLAKIGGSK